MSHQATNWAFQQRGLTPAEKLVLLCLADRHNPDIGCFPSQQRIADDCEISARTVMRAVEKLEAKGLVSREKRRGFYSGLQQSNRYHLAFEPGFLPVEKKPRRDPDPGDKNDQIRVTKCHPNPVREPVRVPLVTTTGEGANHDD